MHLCVEPVLFIALITASINAHSFRMGDMLAWYHLHGPVASMLIAAVFLFLALQAQVGKLPFDIPEAETEIVGGVFIEQSGPKYALFKWYMMAKQLIFCSVFVQIFIPWPRFDFVPLDVLTNLVKVLILVSIIALIDVVNPRLRIDQAVKYYLFLIFFSLGGVAFAIIGA
jgi:formate hydrogenlyase subunit 4